MSQTVIIYPRGVRTEVPRDVCRCPVLQVGDACPVHQQLPDDMLVIDSVPVQLYFTREEITVLAQGLAALALHPPAKNINAVEASAVVWNAKRATSVQRSLATALAEAMY
jgi:hypothetical protein